MPEENNEFDYLEKPSEDKKVICKNCGNDSFKVYITIFIDDAVLICSKCDTQSL